MDQNQARTRGAEGHGSAPRGLLPWLQSVPGTYGRWLFCPRSVLVKAMTHLPCWSQDRGGWKGKLSEVRPVARHTGR